MTLQAGISRLFAWRAGSHFGVIREMYCVTPRCYVIYSFPLINLMHQLGRVIYEPHGHFPRHTGTAQTIDVGNTKAVETEVRLADLNEELLPAAGWLEWEFESDLSLGFANPLEPRM